MAGHDHFGSDEETRQLRQGHQRKDRARDPKTSSTRARRFVKFETGSFTNARNAPGRNLVPTTRPWPAMHSAGDTRRRPHPATPSDLVAFAP